MNSPMPPERVTSLEILLDGFPTFFTGVKDNCNYQGDLYIEKFPDEVKEVLDALPDALAEIKALRAQIDAARDAP